MTLTIYNRDALLEFPVTSDKRTGELLDAKTSAGLGQYTATRKGCIDTIIENKYNTLSIGLTHETASGHTFAKYQIKGECSKDENYGACKACVRALNKSATSTVVNTDDLYHADTGDYYSVV